MGADERPLEGLIDAWLGRTGMRLDPRFPPMLERAYLADTRAGWLRAARLTWIAGLVGMVLATPFLSILLADAHALFSVCWEGVALPSFALNSALLYTRLPRRLQEVTIAITCVVVSAAESVMLAGSARGSGGLLLAAHLGCLMTGLVGSRISVRVGAPLIAVWMGLFAARVGFMPGETAASSIIQTINAAVIACFVIFACWSLEIETRRGYALMLRARLGQMQLSSRNAELDVLAMQDPLTGLANRRAFDSWIAASWQREAAAGRALGLIAIDVDNFKLYNDFYGHPGGDSCLRAVAACLREQLRGTTDMLARVGGEEFAIVLPGVTARHCSDVAERLRQAVFDLQRPHFGKASDRIVTVSLGAASAHPAADIHGPEALMRAADAALYAAKHGGRNCVFVATADGGARDPQLVQQAGV